MPNNYLMASINKWYVNNIPNLPPRWIEPDFIPKSPDWTYNPDVIPYIQPSSTPDSDSIVEEWRRLMEKWPRPALPSPPIKPPDKTVKTFNTSNKVAWSSEELRDPANYTDEIKAIFEAIANKLSVRPESLRFIINLSDKANNSLSHRYTVIVTAPVICNMLVIRTVDDNLRPIFFAAVTGDVSDYPASLRDSSQPKEVPAPPLPLKNKRHITLD